MKLLGNSDRGMKEFAIDLLHNSGDDLDALAAGTFLNKQTLARLMDGQTRHPRYDTIERIFIYFSIDLAATQVELKARYANKPKEKL